MLDGIPVQRSASYLPFDILDLYEARPQTLSRILPTIIDYARQGFSFCPGEMHLAQLGNIDKAVSAFSDAFGAPKYIFQYRTSDTPLQMLPARKQLRFDDNATYLLVGCLGGLGRSLAGWMMGLGARRFTFLSRSGADSKSAAKLVEDLQAAGAEVQVVRGDATSRSDVEHAVANIPSQHPIKGVIHAAMVLRVRTLFASPFHLLPLNAAVMKPNNA